MALIGMGASAEADVDVEAVLVPETNCPLSQVDYHELSHSINLLRESNSYELIYILK